MKNYAVQMIDHHVDSAWWKRIIQHFVKAGDCIELRCWKEETDEIACARRYGEAADAGNEVSIQATATDALLAELMSENPQDKDLYNKMTKYFTLNVKNALCMLCSAHYGTEMYITIYDDNDTSFFESVMRQYTDDVFSIAEWQ